MSAIGQTRTKLADTDTQTIRSFFWGRSEWRMGQESRQKMTFEGNLFIKIPCLLVLSANALETMQWICFPSSQVSLSLTFFHLETLEICAFVKHLSRQSNESLRRDLFLHQDLKICYSPTRNSSYINRKEERLSTLNETLSFYI